jgi:dihydropteroate synthase
MEAEVLSLSTNSDRFNARVCSSRETAELEAEMSNIGAEWAGVVKMVTKAQHRVVRISNVRTPAVLILKEEMLSKGGDCAIHHDAIVNRTERSSCLLMGTDKIFTQVLAELNAQAFDLPAIAGEIRAALDSYRSRSPKMPDDAALPESLRLFYSAMRERTLIMGILNVTPDSFSDGGLYTDFDAAVDHGIRLVEEGADVLDIGGESTHPGIEPLPVDEELSRVIPVVRALADSIGVPISVDTYKPEVARAALDAGASIINDITGFSNPEMRLLVSERCAPSIAMHMKGTPQTMQENPTYEDVVNEVMVYLRERIAELVDAGLPREFIIIDPGIGFGKTSEHNLELLRKLADFKSIGLPILLVTSRKGFIGKLLGHTPPYKRTFGTAATVALGIANGANIVRVHDVKDMSQVSRVADAILHQGRDIQPKHVNLD